MLVTILSRDQQRNGITVFFTLVYPSLYILISEICFLLTVGSDSCLIAIYHDHSRGLGNERLRDMSRNDKNGEFDKIAKSANMANCQISRQDFVKIAKFVIACISGHK